MLAKVYSFNSDGSLYKAAKAAKAAKKKSNEDLIGRLLEEHNISLSEAKLSAEQIVEALFEGVSGQIVNVMEVVVTDESDHEPQHVVLDEPIKFVVSSSSRANLAEWEREMHLEPLYDLIPVDKAVKVAKELTGLDMINPVFETYGIGVKISSKLELAQTNGSIEFLA